MSASGDMPNGLRGTAWRAAALLLLALAAPAQPQPEAKPRWRLLPEMVAEVYGDPDGRLWQVLHSATKSTPQSLVRHQIASEFAADSPRVFGASPALFGPGERVWFLPDDRKSLLGYDGERWTVYASRRKATFTGACPNHYRRPGASANLVVADTAFFPDEYGIHVFNDGAWDYLELTELPVRERAGAYGLPALMPEPDGKGVVACVREKEKMEVWRWRDGDWRPLAWQGVAETDVEALVPAQDGVWFFKTDGRVALVPYGKQPASEFARLLPKLGDASYEAREEATLKMMDLGLLVRPEVEAAVPEADDPEVRERLRRVLEKSRGDGRVYERFAGCGVHHPELWFRADDGTALVRAEDVVLGREHFGKALLLLTADGRTTRLADPRLLALVDRRVPRTPPPLVAEPGKRFWLSGVQGGWNAGLLDLEKKGFVVQVPEPDYARVQAVAPDGTVFLARPVLRGQKPFPVAAFRPDLAEAPLE